MTSREKGFTQFIAAQPPEYGKEKFKEKFVREIERVKESFRVLPDDLHRLACMGSEDKAF